MAQAAGKGKKAASLFTAPYQPGSQAASPQPHEHRPDEFSEGSGIHRVQFVLLAVPQVVVVQRAPGKADAFRCLIVVQQPLEL